MERNPVKAEIARYAQDDSYSSAGYYVKGHADPLVSENLYDTQMGKTAEERRKRYETYLSLEEPYSSLLDKQILIA